MELPWTGGKTHHDYRVKLTCTPQPFGRPALVGLPQPRGLMSKLYKPSGGIFASHKAQCLAYRSQRQSPHDRTLGRTFRLGGALHQPLASGTTSRNRKACPGPPSTARWSRSRPQRRSATPTSPASSNLSPDAANAGVDMPRGRKVTRAG
ncbi:hypothetical protein J4G37_29060 [Microvirga sp. 3-52]|nr:hypothetical protein [Microvirga sp. 3-52]